MLTYTPDSSPSLFGVWKLQYLRIEDIHNHYIVLQLMRFLVASMISSYIKRIFISENASKSLILNVNISQYNPCQPSVKWSFKTGNSNGLGKSAGS